MRRPNVYQRSAPRARRIVAQEPGADYGPAARATIAALPDLLRQAEAAGAVTLARYLGQALSEAEGDREAGDVTSAPCEASSEIYHGCTRMPQINEGFRLDHST